MKRILLSGSLILAFILYGLHQRQESSASGELLAIVPSSPAESPSPSPTPTTTELNVPTAEPTATPTPTPTPSGKYKDGTYTGSVADAFYGNIQVKATVSGGKLTGVDFLQYPNDRPESVRVSQQAIPLLRQEAIQAQSAQVDIVSGASDTSEAFIQSLGAALAKAS